MTYTILVIEAVKRSLFQAVEKLSREHPELGAPKLILLTSHADKYAAYIPMLEIIETDYSSASLEMIFSNMTDEIRAVICRGDMYVQYLRAIIPYLPETTPVATDASLEAATNKRLMRQAFAAKYPEITPGYVRVQDARASTVAEVASKLSFPVIIKPASLASSLLIQKCHDQQALSVGLETTFDRLASVYNQEGRSEPPEVIVEEFMEGEFYSIDSYVRQTNEIDHCPPIHYVPADTLGIDDFFLYKRSAPVALSADEVAMAYTAATKALHAVGLTHSAAHIELVNTKNGWKIIELGPRLGRFRNIMYRETYDIDHGYNDLLIHLGLAPIIPTQVKKYCAAYSFYPHSEGTLKEISHLDELRLRESVCYFKVMATASQYVRQAKNGGHALSEVIIATNNKKQFNDDCRWIEATITAVIQE